MPDTAPQNGHNARPAGLAGRARAETRPRPPGVGTNGLRRHCKPWQPDGLRPALRRRGRPRGAAGACPRRWPRAISTPAAPRARRPVTPRGDGTAAASRPVSQQQTPSTRDQQRRRILNEEFANESRALDNARQQLQQARQRTGLPAAELRELEAQITEREKNLHALRQELGS